MFMNFDGNPVGQCAISLNWNANSMNFKHVRQMRDNFIHSMFRVLQCGSMEIWVESLCHKMELFVLQYGGVAIKSLRMVISKLTWQIKTQMSFLIGHTAHGNGIKGWFCFTLLGPPTYDICTMDNKYCHAYAL